MEDQRKRFIGIDLAKKTMEVRILEEGKKVVCWNAKTDLTGRNRLLKLMKAGDTVTIEACALAFKIAEEILENTKAKVYVLDPRKLQIIWKSKKKTDGEDALKLAQMGMKNTVEELPIVPMPTEEEKKLRSAVHELFFLKRERVRNINRLHSVYVGSGITTLKQEGFEDKRSTGDFRKTTN